MHVCSGMRGTTSALNLGGIIKSSVEGRVMVLVLFKWNIDLYAPRKIRRKPKKAHLPLFIQHDERQDFLTSAC